MHKPRRSATTSGRTGRPHSRATAARRSQTSGKNKASARSTRSAGSSRTTGSSRPSRSSQSSRRAKAEANVSRGAHPAHHHSRKTRYLFALARIILAAFAGLAIYGSYESAGIWLAAPIGIALLLLTFLPWGNRSPAPGPWFGALLGFVQGLVTYLFYLPWVGIYVGAAPWIALAIVEALYSLAFGAGAVWLLRAGAGLPPTSGGAASKSSNPASSRKQIMFCFLGLPCWYLAVEYVRSHWPFGGFAWTRLAWGQVSGPLVSLAKLGGPALVTFAVVVCGVGLVWLVLRRWRAGLVLVALFPLVAGCTWLTIDATPTAPDANSTSNSPSPDTLRIAAVQGNVPRLGLEFNEQRRAVLANHRDETLKLSDQIAAGETPQPDVVLWPENSSDVDPFVDSQARADVQLAVDSVRAPIIFGTITHPKGGERNTVVAWDPATGPGERHDKVYLQPFGEYMPFRSLLRHVSSYVDMAGDFRPGDDNGVVHIKAAVSGQTVAVGVATCYEVAFDGAFQHAVDGGAQILTVPTNNATFGFSDMTYQQLAMSRLRSIEYDRAVVVAATSGVSAIIGPDGKVHERTEIFRPGIVADSLPLRSTHTPAAVVGQWLEWILCGLGVALLVVAVLRVRQAS